MKSEKLKGKDLINVGVFSAIYFVVVMAIAMTGFIPVMLPLLAVFVPILGGIPFMLFLTKVKKLGMIFIMSIIMGIMMILTGMGVYSLFVSIVTGVAAEFLYKSGAYKSAAKAVLTCGVFNMWLWGNYLPLYLNSAQYWADRQNFGQDYVDTITRLMPMWTCPALLVTAFVCGCIGGLLGRFLMKKHFAKAGIV